MDNNELPTKESVKTVVELGYVAKRSNRFTVCVYWREVLVQMVYVDAPTEDCAEEMIRLSVGSGAFPITLREWDHNSPVPHISQKGGE